MKRTESIKKLLKLFNCALEGLHVDHLLWEKLAKSGQSGASFANNDPLVVAYKFVILSTRYIVDKAWVSAKEII